MTRSQYLELCSEYEPGVNKAQNLHGDGTWQDCADPDPLNYVFWEHAGHNLKLAPIFREAGQWVFEEYPDWLMLRHFPEWDDWKLQGRSFGGRLDLDKFIFPMFHLLQPKDKTKEIMILNERFKV